MKLTTSLPSVSWLSRQCEILNISQPCRPPQPVMEIALHYLTLQILIKLKLSGITSEFCLVTIILKHERMVDEKCMALIIRPSNSNSHPSGPVVITVKQTKTNSVALSLRANSTDWSTATCRRNLMSTFVDRGVSCGQRGGSPILTRAEWTPFQTHCYSENLVAPGIEPGPLG
jgi:hypothetical protein